MARVVDVQRGTSIADARSEIKEFYASGTEAASALALDLAQRVNASILLKFSGADGSAALGSTTAGGAGEGELTILRVKESGEIMLSNDKHMLSVGDELTVFQKEEFEDPRNPGKKLVDEIEVGKVKIERISPIGAFARSVSSKGAFDALMIARKSSIPPQQSAEREGSATAAISFPAQKEIPETGIKPTLAIGKFKYSNEFNLSQTADRSGKSITSPGAGQGSVAMGGAILGGVVGGAKSGDASGAVVGAVVGALAGQTADSYLHNAKKDNDAKKSPISNDQMATAIEKESQVLREMVLTKVQKSGKFTVVEQTRKDEIKEQMDNERDGDYDQKALIQRGKMQSARYSAFGTLTRFEADRTQEGFSIAGGKERVTMKITLELRLVDNERGTVVGSDQVTGSIQTESSQVGFLGFGTASENQGAIGVLLDDLSEKVVAKVITTLWPITIISVNADEKVVTINAGETVVSVRDRLIVYAQGANVIDPASGEVLGHEEVKVGELQVSETTAKFSKCRIVTPPQERSAIQVGHICRPRVTTVAEIQAPDRSLESKPKFTF